MSNIGKKSIEIIIGTCLVASSMFVVHVAYAHPGNTASDGCHYCRTNCSKWGEVRGARHCHGMRTTSTKKEETSPWFYILGIGTVGAVGYSIFRNRD